MPQLTHCPTCHKILHPNPFYAPGIVVFCFEHGDYFLYRERGKEDRIIYRPFRGKQRVYIKKEPPIPRGVGSGVGRAKCSIRCEQNNVVYTSQMAAAEALDIRQSEISKHLRGQRHGVGGYTFVYVVDDGIGNTIELPRSAKVVGALRRMYAIRCNETGEVFESVAHASRAMNLGKGNLYSHLRGHKDRARVGGFTFTKVK